MISFCCTQFIFSSFFISGDGTGGESIYGGVFQGKNLYSCLCLSWYNIRETGEEMTGKAQH